MNKPVDENHIITERRAKLKQLRESNKTAYPNDFIINETAEGLNMMYDDYSVDKLAEVDIKFSIAGRIMAKRVMGKASFIKLHDGTDQIQAYVQRDNLPEGVYQQFKSWDVGDIVGVAGHLFRTKTNELTLQATTIRLLVKSIRPLPEKYHGLTDQEARYRQRYLDLLMNDKSRNVFIMRSKIIRFIRDFFENRDFLEVETPMMHAIAGGATARPFVTHHNTLDTDLYLRVAPELYLKRLIVGGFDRVYEINRNFRNEGVSTQHNPEFTMLEFYQSYATYHDLMDLTERLIRELALHLFNKYSVTYQDREYDLSQSFTRLSMKDAIVYHNESITLDMLQGLASAREIAMSLGIELPNDIGLGKIIFEIFEKTVEPKLIDPTFITEYPTEVSPLSRRNDDDPSITDRFEFFMAGRELANGFSELNDPEDQAERFMMQAKAKAEGDLEAMHYDEDYVTALEYGMPPTAGEGIGIDRLVMFFTDCPSIRDVLLFPYMRLKRNH